MTKKVFRRLVMMMVAIVMIVATNIPYVREGVESLWSNPATTATATIAPATPTATQVSTAVIVAEAKAEVSAIAPTATPAATATATATPVPTATPIPVGSVEWFESQTAQTNLNMTWDPQAGAYRARYEGDPDVVCPLVMGAPGDLDGLEVVLTGSEKAPKVIPIILPNREMAKVPFPVRVCTDGALKAAPCTARGPVQEVVLRKKDAAAPELVIGALVLVREGEELKPALLVHKDGKRTAASRPTNNGGGGNDLQPTATPAPTLDPEKEPEVTATPQPTTNPTPTVAPAKPTATPQGELVVGQTPAPTQEPVLVATAKPTTMPLPTAEPGATVEPVVNPIPVVTTATSTQAPTTAPEGNVVPDGGPGGPLPELGAGRQ